MKLTPEDVFVLCGLNFAATRNSGCSRFTVIINSLIYGVAQQNTTLVFFSALLSVTSESDEDMSYNSGQVSTLSLREILDWGSMINHAAGNLMPKLLFPK